MTVTSTIRKNGFQSWWKSAEMKLYGVTTAPKEVRIGADVTREWHYDSQTRSITLTVPDAVNNWTVRVAF